MDLVKLQGPALRGKFRFPNIIVFPKELRDAIPEYGSRALVFDSVSGSCGHEWFTVSGMIGADQLDASPQARIEFLVHETGKLDGEYSLLACLDAPTTRALGEFFIQLADQAEAKTG